MIVFKDTELDCSCCQWMLQHPCKLVVLVCTLIIRLFLIVIDTCMAQRLLLPQILLLVQLLIHSFILFYGVDAFVKASQWAGTFADTSASIRKGKISKTRARIPPQFCQAEISIHRSDKPINEKLSCTSSTLKYSNFSYIFTFVHNLSYLFISSIEVFITKVCNNSTKAMQTTESAV